MNTHQHLGDAYSPMNYTRINVPDMRIRNVGDAYECTYSAYECR